MQGYRDNFIPEKLSDENPLHTPEKPFCYDSCCSCHEDTLSISIVVEHVSNGLMTPGEATDFVMGRGI